MDAKQRNGGGFWISIGLLAVLFSVVLLPDIIEEYSLSSPKLPRLEFRTVRAAIADPLIRLSFAYVGADEYVGSAPKIQNSALEEEKFTVLLLGMVGEGHISPYLTDSILLVHIDLTQDRVIAISLPRDLLVNFPQSRFSTRINTLYQTGLQHSPEDPSRFIREKIKEITGLSVSRWVTVDLASFTAIIDALGGVTVYVEEDINDTRFPTPEGGYTVFAINKGWQQLDGQTASQYIRTRHTPKGDIARIGRQQQVAIALQHKISGLHPLFDLKTIFDVLNSLKGRVKTDFSAEEISALWSQGRNLNKERVAFYSIDAFEKNSLLVSSRAGRGEESASVLIPRAGFENYREIQEYVRQVTSNP